MGSFKYCIEKYYMRTSIKWDNVRAILDCKGTILHGGSSFNKVLQVCKYYMDDNVLGKVKTSYIYMAESITWVFFCSYCTMGN